MIRLSNNVSGKAIKALGTAALISFGLNMLSFVGAGDPTFWMQYFGVDPANIPFLLKLFLVTAAFAPVFLILAMFKMPSRVTITSKQITVRYFYGESTYPLSAVRDAYYDPMFLNIHVGKTKIEVEVDPGQILELRKYLPTLRAFDSKNQ